MLMSLFNTSVVMDNVVPGGKSGGRGGGVDIVSLKSLMK